MMIDFNLLNSLEKQFKQHGSLIIAFDFDDTVYPLYVGDEELILVRQCLRRARALGHKLILSTCRSFSDFRNEHVEEFLQERDLVPDCWNTNLIVLEDMGEDSKLYYNILLDDKAGLPLALGTLNYFLDRQEQGVLNK